MRVELREASDADRTLMAAAVACTAACGLRQEEPPVARPMPPPPAAVDRRRRRDRPPPPEPVARADRRAARAGARRRDRVGVARRSEPQLAAQAGVLRARQQRDQRRTARRRSTRTPALLKRYPSWTVTIEGHCDERGTAEYNLALGERRAVAARAYLVSLGISGRSAADGQLRQGIPVRSGPRRSGVREEPPRAFRHHREVKTHETDTVRRHRSSSSSPRARPRPRRPPTRNISS